ncbi:MAG: serine/threonine-protein kinase [Gemmatimonadales bacterium]
MSVPDDLLLTKSDGRSRPSDTPTRSSTQLPLSLLRNASKRLQAVCVVLIVSLAIGWLGTNWIEGDLPSEFADALQYGPDVTMIVGSLVVLGLIRSSWLSPAGVITLGLVYQVVISFCIPISEYYGAFRGVGAEQITDDLVGLSTVAIWMMFFAVLVPARPRHALIALTLSGSAVPITVALLTRFGDAPVLEPQRFLFVFVLPYAMMVVVSYIAARIIYGLGKEVLRAQEMGSYRLLELIGRGGMGEVWKARHNLLARPAAIKLILGGTLEAEPGGAANALARFEREAQATASLQSAHTVALYDFGVSDDGTFYYVMELLDGIDLESLVERFGPLPAERVVHILRQACLSLGEAHQRGLVHRDIKPANLYLCQYAFEPDFVKVLDFGLVKHPTLDVPGGVALTRTGLLAGTPSYLAPEIAMGAERIDGRADIYALACVSYKLLTGRCVFEEDTALATILAHVNVPARSPSSISELPIPADLEELILACLAKDPASRPPTCEDLLRALEGIDLAEPWTTERAADWWHMHVPERSVERTAAPLLEPVHP